MGTKSPAAEVAQYAASEVRSWLREHGVEVGVRGRISVERLAEYLEGEPERAKQLAKQFGTKGIAATAAAMSRPGRARAGN